MDTSALAQIRGSNRACAVAWNRALGGGGVPGSAANPNIHWVVSLRFLVPKWSWSRYVSGSRYHVVMADELSDEQKVLELEKALAAAELGGYNRGWKVRDVEAEQQVAVWQRRCGVLVDRLGET